MCNSLSLCSPCLCVKIFVLMSGHLKTWVLNLTLFRVIEYNHRKLLYTERDSKIGFWLHRLCIKIFVFTRALP